MDRDKLDKLNAQILELKGVPLDSMQYHKDYSGNIIHAIDLLEESPIGYRMEKFGSEFHLKYKVQIWDKNGEDYTEFGDTLPEAICKIYIRLHVHILY